MMGWEDTLKKPGALATDLEQASRDRIDDARALIAASRPAAAIASAIYALEMRLKVLICRRLNLSQLPRAFEFHDLDALLIASGLRNQLDDPPRMTVKGNWFQIIIISNRLNFLRYAPDRNWNMTQTQEFMKWLEDPQDGVLPWLMSQP